MKVRMSALRTIEGVYLHLQAIESILLHLGAPELLQLGVHIFENFAGLRLPTPFA